MREVHTSLLVDLDDLDFKLIAFMHDILDLSDAMARELGDVAKPLLARQDFNESTEVHDARDSTLVDSADFHIAHVSSMIFLIVLPPEPMTSRILSTWIFMTVTRGA